MPKKKPVSKTVPLGIDDFLCFSLYSTGLAFNRVYKPFLDELGLTYPQYLVMLALWAEDNLTVGGLGRQLFLESNTLTPLLKRLEGVGLLKRVRDEDDERRVLLRLTAAGKALQEKAKHVPSCIFDAIGLSEEKLMGLQNGILELRENLLSAVQH